MQRRISNAVLHIMMWRCKDVHSVAKVELHLCCHAEGVRDMCVHAGSVCGRQLAAVRLVRARSVQVAPQPQRPEHGLHSCEGQRDSQELACALDADVRPRVYSV